MLAEVTDAEGGELLDGSVPFGWGLEVVWTLWSVWWGVRAFLWKEVVNSLHRAFVEPLPLHNRISPRDHRAIGRARRKSERVRLNQVVHGACVTVQVPDESWGRLASAALHRRYGCHFSSQFKNRRCLGL